jgi:hypothetical protein
MAYGTVNADVIGTSVAGSNLGAGNASIMKNRIINGAMMIDQRNSGSSITGTGGGKYATDRWRWDMDSTPTLAIQQSTTAPVGFSNSLYANFTGSTTVSAGASNTCLQKIEGFNTADLNWGTANAKTVTISFWVQSSITGTYGLGIANYASNWSYPAQYTISAANTWEYKTITIAGPTSGTWVGATNSVGVVVLFDMGSGTGSEGTANTWQSGLKTRVAGNVNFCTQSSATWYVTGVQLEVGSSATGFEYVNYQTSLANCQRYCWVVNGDTTPTSFHGSSRAGVSKYISLALPVAMRATPSFSTTGSVRVLLYTGAYNDSSTGSMTVGGVSPTPYINNSIAILFYSGSMTTVGDTANSVYGFFVNGGLLTVSAEL